MELPLVKGVTGVDGRLFVQYLSKASVLHKQSPLRLENLHQLLVKDSHIINFYVNIKLFIVKVLYLTYSVNVKKNLNHE